MRLLALVFTIAGALGCTPNSEAITVVAELGPEDYKIIDSTSKVTFKLGDTIESAIQVLGKPNETTFAVPGNSYDKKEWPGICIYLMVGYIQIFEISNSRFETIRGAKIGIDQKAVEKYYGKPKKVLNSTLIYQFGEDEIVELKFSLSQSGVVEKIVLTTGT